MSDLEHDAYDIVITSIGDALDAAGVPVAAPEDSPVSVGQPMGLEARVRWLITERNTLQTMKEALDHAAEALDAAGAPRTTRDEFGHGVDLELSLVGRIQRLAAERDQLRKMHYGVSTDLDRERREHQEVAGEAAAREVRLTEERDNAQHNLNKIYINFRRIYKTESFSKALEIAIAQRDAQQKLDHFVAQRDAEVASFMKQRDKAIADAEESSRRYNTIADERQRDVDVLAKAREIADNAEDTIAMLKAKVARLTVTKKPIKKKPAKKARRS